MTTLLVLLLFAFVLVGGFVVFLLLEAYASSDQDDQFHTLSYYIKRLRRRLGVAGAVVLAAIILLPALWLLGHLVFEWW